MQQVSAQELAPIIPDDTPSARTLAAFATSVLLGLSFWTMLFMLLLP